MQQEQDPSPEYLKGFNQMYKLMREMPEVAKQILSAKAGGDRSKGMAAGAREYELELMREASRKNREQSLNRER